MRESILLRDTETNGDAASAAAAWLARLQGGGADRAAFDAWLNASAENRAAWLEARRLWRDLDVVEGESDLETMRREALAAAPAPAGIDRRRLATAAGVAVAGLFGAAWWWREDHASPGPVRIFDTGVGQQASFRLDDGSTVTLSTDSAVQVGDWSHTRALTLVRGQAFFQVAKDAGRPFIVTAGDKRVTAVGTAFDVRLDPGRLAVTLVEGRVRIGGLPGDRGARSVEMAAGSQFVADGADWRVSDVDTAKASSWLKGQLVFDGEPLSGVVAEMNRFSNRKLRIADPALSRTRVSGVFRTGQVDAFASALQAYGLVRISGSSDTTIDLARP
jgi:transmembrane sensor